MWPTSIFSLDLAPVPKLLLSVGLDVWQFCQVNYTRKGYAGSQSWTDFNLLDISQEENIVEDT
jgi:hypothetical protein